MRMRCSASERYENEEKETNIESFDILVEAWLDTFCHETAAASATEVVLYALFAETVLLLLLSVSHLAEIVRTSFTELTVPGDMTYLDKFRFQADRFKLDTLVLNIDIQVPVASAYRAVAFHYPAVNIVQRRGQGHSVADELTMTRRQVLVIS